MDADSKKEKQIKRYARDAEKTVSARWSPSSEALITEQIKMLIMVPPLMKKKLFDKELKSKISANERNKI